MSSLSQKNQISLHRDYAVPGPAQELLLRLLHSAPQRRFNGARTVSSEPFVPIPPASTDLGSSLGCSGRG